MIKRRMEEYLLEAAKGLPVVGVFGPRQSGKTTLVRDTFKNHRYFSLELPSIRDAIKADPIGFINNNRNEHGIIFDEFQYVPELLSYIQVDVDNHQKSGYFVLTGSQNFLMNEAITQSLAGRIALFTLLPLSVAEMQQSGYDFTNRSALSLMFNGFYPRVVVGQEKPYYFYNDYTHTYLERDVRTLKSVVDLLDFKRFMGLCAGRVGQLLDISELARDAGIDRKTAKAWLSVLEASYVLYLVQPYFKDNFGKRLVKTPKLYFYDTGLACSLLDITSEEQLLKHYLRGALFESFVVSELMKYFYNIRRTPPIYFWRDSSGNEVDCIVEVGHQIMPIEIKASQTFSQDFYKGFKYLKEVVGDRMAPGIVIYAGDMPFSFFEHRGVNWQMIDKIFSTHGLGL